MALIIEETSADGEHQRSHVELTLDDSAQPVVWMSDEMTKPDLIVDPELLVGEADFSVERVEAGISQLDPGKRAAYTAAGVLMGALLAVYAIVGVFLRSMVLSKKTCARDYGTGRGDPAHKRAESGLTVACPVHNELGRLCDSFEKMRKALYDNNLKLWRSIEVRQTMQASVAHDLRNPLAIMEGTVEHTRAMIPAGEHTVERLETALETMAVTAKRMERYTDYIGDLTAIEDTELHMTEAVVPKFLREAVEGLRVLADSKGLTVSATYDVPECGVQLDREIFYRVLENFFSNAARYAQSRSQKSGRLFCGFDRFLTIGFYHDCKPRERSDDDEM